MQTEASINIVQEKKPVTHKQFVALSFPLILATLSTPLLGAVDTAVVGYLPDPVYIGGVAVATLIFNTMYWLLGFLRVSTSGFTAQAFGSKNQTEMIMTLARPLFFATLFGVFFIIMQNPIREAALWLIHPPAAVGTQAMLYFDIRIWGAPFVLMNYTILGWFIGASKVSFAVILQIGMTLLNILLSLLFVLVLGMGVEGVAAASLMAEMMAVCVGCYIVYKQSRFSFKELRWAKLMDKAPIVKMVQVNRDLFIRTICLLTVFGLFTTQGAKMGEVALAANAILLQIQFIMASFFDGMANASSILVGRSVGEKNGKLYTHTIKLSATWAFVTSVVLGILFFLSGNKMVSLFTSIEEVILVASQYEWWLCLYPIVAFWGLQLNGIFSGATYAAPIRDTLIISLGVYLVGSWTLIPIWGNHGLWASFILFSLVRTLVLWLYLPRLKRVIIDK